MRKTKVLLFRWSKCIWRTYFIMESDSTFYALFKLVFFFSSDYGIRECESSWWHSRVIGTVTIVCRVLWMKMSIWFLQVYLFPFYSSNAEFKIRLFFVFCRLCSLRFFKNVFKNSEKMENWYSFSFDFENCRLVWPDRMGIYRSSYKVRWERRLLTKIFCSSCEDFEVLFTICLHRERWVF